MQVLLEQLLGVNHGIKKHLRMITIHIKNQKMIKMKMTIKMILKEILMMSMNIQPNHYLRLEEILASLEDLMKKGHSLV